MKAFLKWAGGKSRIAADIENYLKDGKRLVEPFVGSGAVFLNTSFEKYLLCDTNSDLINLYNNLKQKPEELMEKTKEVFSPNNNTELKFYELRDEFNALGSEDIRKSSLFIYLNKHAFNGLCRYNQKGFFNVPYGRYKAPKCPLKEMQAFATKAEFATFKCQDFEDTFKEITLEDVVYCDPPYVPLSITSSFTSYSKDGFDLKDQVRLAKNAIASRAKGISCVISNNDLEITRKIYEGSDIHQISVQRHIASKASSRKKAKEIIAVF